MPLDRRTDPRKSAPAVTSAADHLPSITPLSWAEQLPVVVLISGSGSNLKALLDAATTPTYPARIVAVGSDTDAPGLEHASNAGVPTFTLKPRDFVTREQWGEALANEIQAHLPGPRGRSLIVSAGLMRILPEPFVRRFYPYLINTHPALLPNFPGAHAVRDALKAGVIETGASVHLIDAGVDTGAVLRQQSVPIFSSDTEATLHERIKTVERPLLVRTVRDIATGALRLTATHTTCSPYPDSQ